MLFYYGFSILAGQLNAEFVKMAKHNEHLTEKLLMNINDIEKLNEHTSYENIDFNNDKIILRSENGEGSFITFNEGNKTEEWAVEFTVEHLNLKNSQKAGFFLWYTDEEVKKGSFKGIQGNFKGFLTGIEFSKNKADIVFTYNPLMDYTGKENLVLKYDHINPDLIEDVKELRVKIIHTRNNFKVELYDNDRLLSDSFKINDHLVDIGEEGKKHFAITTTYTNCPKKVSFKLKDLKIFERNEHENYNSMDTHTSEFTFKRNKNEEELRHAIADVNHFISYLTHALGGKDKSKIVEMTLELKKLIREHKNSIEYIIITEKEHAKANYDSKEKDYNDKLIGFDNRLHEIYLNIEKFKKLVSVGETKAPNSLNKLIFFLLISTLCLYALKLILSSFVKNKKIIKKE